MNFLIFCNRMDVQKIPRGPPFYIFRHYATYRRLQKIIGKILSIFSFLRAFVVSSCTKSGFRVLLSLRYGADLGRSRLVVFRFASVFYLHQLRMNLVGSAQQWIPDIINVGGTTCGVSYNRTFLYAGLKRNYSGSRFLSISLNHVATR